MLIGKILRDLSLFPMGLLIYTLTRRDDRKILLTHPRVILELALFLVLLLVGVILRYQEHEAS